jgi:dTDP-4-amino-4,6-dideoxygalactose transaminase
MKLLYKQASQKTKEAMTKIAKNPELANKNDFEKETKSKILSKTNHKECEIVNSGNAAIMVAMNAISGPILIPDQGAWHGFKQIAKFLNKEIIQIKTDLGMINEEVLNKFLKENPLDSSQNNTNDTHNKQALFLTSFAGYTGEQPIEEIANWCRENNILLVEDASGAITDPEKNLANGNYSDIIIASTSSPKVINVGDGGFISTNIENIFEKSSILLKIAKSNNITKCGIAKEIDFAENNLKKTLEATKYIKNNLDNVIHQDKRGTNVIIRTGNKHNIAKNLKEEFDLGGKSIITKCPNYNRLKIKGIAIEIKNIDTKSLTKENLDEIIAIIKNQ